MLKKAMLQVLIPSLQFFGEDTFLKDLLGEELAKQVGDKLGDKKLGVVNDGSWLPKAKFNELNDQVKDYKEQLKQRDTQLKELSDKAVGNEALESKIKELQNENKQAAADYEAKLTERDFNYALDSALLNAKVHNTKAVKALLESEKITLKDGKLEGLDDQIKALKTSDAYLFQSEQAPPTPPHTPGGTTPPAGGETDPFAAAMAQKGYNK